LSLTVAADAATGASSLLVRPERLHVLAGDGTPDGDVNVVQAHVEEIVYLGNERRYTLDGPDGRKLIARRAVGEEDRGAVPGERVVVWWRVEDGVVIPNGWHEAP
jgi:putative spermidine/putrescine transport system ATP-binding protein